MAYKDKPKRTVMKGGSHLTRIRIWLRIGYHIYYSDFEFHEASTGLRLCMRHIR